MRTIYLFLITGFVITLGCSSDEIVYDIRYEVYGVADSATITCYDSNGNLVTRHEAPLPVVLHVEAGPGDAVYLSAINTTEDQAGLITVTIYKNGELFTAATGEGVMTPVTASGTL